jgi:chemotaxis methyl-accepting protein methylase
VSGALEQVAEVVRRETGIGIKDAQMSSLEAALSRLEPAMDAGDFLRAHAGGGTCRKLIDSLIDEVTIKETFLFRQREELDTIDWPALLWAARSAGSETVRVWVAACATGEEAYTLAMLASGAFASPEPPISITATDISPAALDRARAGHYRGRSLAALDDTTRARHFDLTGDGVAVGERLRRLVEFGRHNLVTDLRPPGDGQFELIVCRNVLIYFDGDTVERVVSSLESAVAPGGMLILGAADRLFGSVRRLARSDKPARPEQRRDLRRPLGRVHPRAPAGASGLAAALQAANEGDLDEAVELTAALLSADALDADAHFVRGMAELGLGDTRAAVSSLRRALYVDPGFGLAAFTLGRAHEQSGDGAAAARAYEQTLRALNSEETRHTQILDQVDFGDVAAACAIRLRALRGGSA